MKVAILSAGIPSQKYPMMGLFAFDQAKALKKIGIEVSFLCVDLRSIRRRRRLGYYSGIKDGIAYHIISIPIGAINPLLRVVGRFSVKYLFAKAFKGGSYPSIIHAHFTEMGDLAYVLKEKYHVPYVLTEHSSLINADVIPPYVMEMALKGYRHADRVITVSSTLAKRVKFHTDVDSVIIPNIIDTTLFTKCERLPHKGLRLVTTSNLIPLKRTKLILVALKNCKVEGLDIHLDIIGDGVLRQSLIDYTNARGLSSFVTFHGILKREDMVKLYAKADCFVLVSSTETFGVSYVEAMAAGLPVIATKCGGPEDFVSNQNGLLIDVDDVQQLKDAFIYMYTHHHDYNSLSIKDYVNRLFSPEVVAKQILNEYNEVLKNIN